MLAISTYTEPVPISTAVNEPPRAVEPKEDEEPGEFAKLLERLLEKSEENAAEENSPVGFSEAESNSDVLIFEEAEAGNKLDLLGITKKIRDSLKAHDSDDEIPEEHLSVMLNSEHLFARSLENNAADSDADDLLPEISNLKITNNLPEAELEPDSFIVDLSKETFGADEGVTQIAASLSAMQDIEEALSAADGKKGSLSKDRPVSKDENVEALSGKAARSEELASLRGKPENESPSRLDELRSRRRDRVTFEVRDLRTGEANSLNNQTRSYTVTEAATGRAHGETPVREITLELRLPEQNNGSTAQTTWEAKAGGTAIENMLARELHQNFNGDIVRHASMALRDGGEGTIKIALKPESLGNVKIRLEMTENKITGHIVVESEEALNAFRKEIASLEQAFRDSGFNSADLNLSLTADGRNAQGQEQEQNSFTPRMIASRYDDSSDYAEYDARVIDVFVGRKSGSINMLA